MTAIDLNSDLGEGAGEVDAVDAHMLELVTSANVACGFHAGDAGLMRETVGQAVERGVAIGAHVSYDDREGFGRRTMDVPSERLIPEIVYQIGALQAMASSLGGRVSYVKPHGALYNTIVHDERQARDVVAAIKSVDDSLVVLGLPGSQVLRIAEAAGLPTALEAFADRAYTPEGTLVSRSEPGAVLHDPDVVATRMLELVESGRLRAVDGSWVRLTADSICVHGDSPGALDLARGVAEHLRRSGVSLNPFTGGQG